MSKRYGRSTGGWLSVSDRQLLIVGDGSCYESPLADSLSDILLQVATGDGWAVEIARYIYPTPDDGPSYGQD